MNLFFLRIYSKLSLHSIDSFSLDPSLFQFITVTSYQNPVVTDLKLKHNPAARNPSSTLWKKASKGLKRKTSLNDSAYNSSFSSDSPPSPKRVINAIAEDGFLHEPLGKVIGISTISYGEPLVPELLDDDQFLSHVSEMVMPEMIVPEMCSTEMSISGILENALPAFQHSMASNGEFYNDTFMPMTGLPDIPDMMEVQHLGIYGF